MLLVAVPQSSSQWRWLHVATVLMTKGHITAAPCKQCWEYCLLAISGFFQVPFLRRDLGSLPYTWLLGPSHVYSTNGITIVSVICTNLDFSEARDCEWLWHQLGRMQVCTSLQTDNYAGTPPLGFLQAGYSSCHPTNSVKALKALTNKTKNKHQSY